MTRLAALFGAAFLYAILALVMSVRAFWRDIGEPIGMKADAGSLWQAIKDASQLRYLDGGGVGCFNEDDQPTDRRKIFHHLTFYGFILCFAATCVATLYHYLLAREAPYAWWDLPVRARHARRHRASDRTRRIIGREVAARSRTRRFRRAAAWTPPSS